MQSSHGMARTHILWQPKLQGMNAVWVSQAHNPWNSLVLTDWEVSEIELVPVTETASNQSVPQKMTE